ncbi:MAG: rod-binding protein [Burkholderiales bacterium]
METTPFKVTNSFDISATLAVDPKALNALKREAKSGSKEGLQAAARQFEAVLLGMMLKSMRAATPKEGLFDSDQSRTYTEMLDQQLAQHLASGHGIGLADLIVKQLDLTRTAAHSIGSAGVESASDSSNKQSSRHY